MYPGYDGSFDKSSMQKQLKTVDKNMNKSSFVFIVLSKNYYKSSHLSFTLNRLMPRAGFQCCNPHYSMRIEPMMVKSTFSSNIQLLQEEDMINW